MRHQYKFWGILAIFALALSGCFQSTADEDYHPGQAAPPANLVINSTQAFGIVDVGDGYVNESNLKTVTISNAGRRAAQNLQFAVDLPFTISSHNCGTSLAKGTSCTVNIGYSPSYSGESSATVTITYDNGDEGTQKSYTMTATGFEPPGEWTWKAGSSTPNATGTLGSKGVTASSNVPPAGYEAVPFTDNSGNLWLFGGSGTAAGGAYDNLWKWDGSNWTWVQGKGTSNGDGVTTSGPGARSKPAAWVDASGNFWIFGGRWIKFIGGYNSDPKYYNDLWKWNGSSWTQFSVSTPGGMNQNGSYGTKGVVAASNLPFPTFRAATWRDSSNNLWMFGGKACVDVDSYHSGYCEDTNGEGYLNALWKYDIAANRWTWISGSSGANQTGTYGTKGVANSANVPGARMGAASWIDASGNFWLFGGFGFAEGDFGALNDLWKWDGTNWTWVSGSNLASSAGSAGTRGLRAASNQPSARTGAAAWKDSSGNFWLFGGEKTGSSIDRTYAAGALNDVWKWDGTYWTLITGNTTTNRTGTYGALGSSSENYQPGSRMGAVPWIDSTGKAWIFGGKGYGSSGAGGLNDLWSFAP